MLACFCKPLIKQVCRVCRGVEGAARFRGTRASRPGCTASGRPSPGAPPKAEGGIVPKNERGTVALPTAGCGSPPGAATPKPLILNPNHS